MKALHAITALLLAAFILMAPRLGAQRRVNPVKAASGVLQGKNENRQEKDSLDLSQYARFKDSNGREVLVDTVTGQEVPDSVINAASPAGSRIPRMEQPLFYAAAVSADIWDPVMRLFGQKYGLMEFSAELNLHNRYIPVVEIGLGQTSYTPDDNNYTYKVNTTPYFRIGANYNFLYNSNPDYMVYAGLRLGWSRFGYQVNNVTLTSSYWDETTTFNLPRQTCSVTYLQVLFGLRVKIYGPVSMGWNLRYKTRLHESPTPFGAPWYIPGYGTRTSAISGSFQITYTLPIKKKEQAAPEAAAH